MMVHWADAIVEACGYETICFLTQNIIQESICGTPNPCTLPNVLTLLSTTPASDTIIFFKLTAAHDWFYERGHAWCFAYRKDTKQWILMQSFQQRFVLQTTRFELENRKEFIRAIQCAQINESAKLNSQNLEPLCSVLGLCGILKYRDLKKGHLDQLDAKVVEPNHFRANGRKRWYFKYSCKILGAYFVFLLLPELFKFIYRRTLLLQIFR